jgi:hypothetical protein
VTRAWEYRQRHLAHGVWFRLRCLLAQSERAYAIDPEEARRLVALGARPAAVGDELQPPRPIVVLSPGVDADVRRARALPVALSADLLTAPALALLPFAGRHELPER